MVLTSTSNFEVGPRKLQCKELKEVYNVRESKMSHLIHSLLYVYPNDFNQDVDMSQFRQFVRVNFVYSACFPRHVYMTGHQDVSCCCTCGLRLTYPFRKGGS